MTEHTEIAERFDRQRAIVRVGGPIAIFGLAWINWQTPFVRFDSSIANVCFFLLMMLVPTIALVAGPGTGSSLTRLCLRFLLLPFALAGLGIAFVGSIWLPDTISRGAFPLFARVARYPTGPTQLTLYRADCGFALCDKDIMVVRRERPVLPGFLIVRDVCSNGPADSAAVRMLDEHRIELRLLTKHGTPMPSFSPDTCASPPL